LINRADYIYVHQPRDLTLPHELTPTVQSTSYKK